MGMMVPMGFFLGLGYANVIGDPNDIESLRDTISNSSTKTHQFRNQEHSTMGFQGL